MTTTHDDQTWMHHALTLADKAEQLGEVPVGAVLVRDGEVLAEGWNHPIQSNDPSMHAEMHAVRAACERLGNYRLPKGTTLYVTLEPCSMCAGALIHARVGRVVYGAADARTGAAGSVFEILGTERLNHFVEVTGGVLESQCREKLQAFFRARR